MSLPLWKSIETRLDHDLADWRGKIDCMGQVRSVEKREAGGAWGNDELFEALVRSILSANTDWAKVQRILPQLSALFHGFSLDWYSDLQPSEINQTLIPWFKQRKAGSQSLGASLRHLIECAKQLRKYCERYGSIESYLAQLSAQHNADPKAVAATLGEQASPAKLPGLGVALAAEFLKNIGYDISKPDRHINRAVGSFGLVHFANWADKRRTLPPTAGKHEIRTVMRVMENWAHELGFRATFLDNAIWLLCAKNSGLYLSNSELAALKPPAAT